MVSSRLFWLLVLPSVLWGYFDKESEVPPWMNGYSHRSAVWKDSSMLHDWYTHDPWHILNEITLDAGQGLCLDTVDMRAHRPNYGSEEMRKNWVFVPIGGKIYGAPFADSERCIFADSGSTGEILSKILEGAGHKGMANWVPVDGGIIGFAIMVSDPPKDPNESDGVRCGSPKCRSNIVWSRLRGVDAPGASALANEIVKNVGDGASAASAYASSLEFELERVGVVDRWSSGPIMFEKPRVRGIPEMRKITDEMQKKYPEAVKAYDRIYHKVKDYAATEENYELHDRVVQKLHSLDPFFGHYAPLEGYEGGKPSLVGPVGYWLGAGSPGGEVPNTHNEVHYVDYRHGGKVVWNAAERYSTNAHKWRLPRKWIYPRAGAPDYGYDPNHPGPLPLVHRRLVETLRKIDGEQAGKLEEIHRKMFSDLQGIHRDCTGPHSGFVAQAERQKARLLSDYGRSQSELLLDVHRERMKFFEKPRKPTDSLVELFGQGQGLLMEGLGTSHGELFQNLGRAHRACTATSQIVAAVESAEAQKARIIREAAAAGAKLLEEYHAKRMEIVGKF